MLGGALEGAWQSDRREPTNRTWMTFTGGLCAERAPSYCLAEIFTSKYSIAVECCLKKEAVVISKSWLCRRQHSDHLMITIIIKCKRRHTAKGRWKNVTKTCRIIYPESDNIVAKQQQDLR